MREAYLAADTFVSRLHQNCSNRGATLLILVDHGQEPVVGVIPLKRLLRRSGVRQEEYSYFLEVGQARFWFHTEEARQTLKPLLRSLKNATLLDYRELHTHNIRFEDDAYGEFYLFANPGHIFFPHDYYQPLANLFLGLGDRHQRSRLFKPCNSLTGLIFPA